MDRSPYQSSQSPNRLRQTPSSIQTSRPPRARSQSRSSPRSVRLQRLGWPLSHQGTTPMKPKSVDCPRCGNSLGANAKFCGCGWKRPTQVAQDHPPLLCATAGCPHNARVRVRRAKPEWQKGKPNPVSVPHGAWLNLCHACEDRIRHEENVEYCKLMGLDTPAKQRAWCLAQVKRGTDMLRPERALREPGQEG
mgnify:FL=1